MDLIDLVLPASSKRREARRIAANIAKLGQSFAQHATTMFFAHFVGDGLLIRTGLVEALEY